MPLASRVSFRRFFMLLAATLVVAVFANTSISQRVFAADATWTGTTLTYGGNTFQPATSPPDRAGEPTEYRWVDSSTRPPTATVIYFATGNQYTATSATLVTYSVVTTRVGVIHANPSAPRTITVAPSGAPAPEEDHSIPGTTCDSRVTKGIGWVLCPISSWLSDAIDGIYEIVESYLEVNTITNSDTAIFQVWNLVRTVANVCFVIAFLIVIYSQLTSIGFSNYNLKDMLPRMVIAAILVNISFWICSLAIDLSNLLGHSINNVLIGVRGDIDTTANGSWTQVTNYILSGGTAVLGFAAVTSMGGSLPAIGFALLAGLISAGVAVLVAFIVLAARQAIIMIMLIVSPLAFIASVLPNTRSLFDKWQKAFMALLVFFPIFSMLFGGSQLVGDIIITSADGRLHIILIGLTVKIVPLIITPLIVRFSSGLLGKVAGMVNDKGRGLADRGKKWARAEADYHKSEALRKSDLMPGKGNRRGWLRPSQVARRLNKHQLNRDADKKDNDDYVAHRAEKDRQRRYNEAPEPPTHGPDRRSRRERRDYDRRQSLIRSHDYHEQAETHRKRIDSDAAEHWQHSLAHDQNYAALRSHREQTHLAQGRADVHDKAMTAADDRKLKSAIYNTPHLRNTAIMTAVDTHHAASYQTAIDSSAEKIWKVSQSEGTLRSIRASAAFDKGVADVYEAHMAGDDSRNVKYQIQANSNLKQMATEAGVYNKEAGLYQEVIDTAVDKAWAHRQENVSGIRTIRREVHDTRAQAKTMDDAMTATDNRAFERRVNTDPGYLGIRRRREQTVRDNEHAQLQSALSDARGKQQFQEDVRADAALQRLVADTHESQKRAEQAKTLTDQEADAHWENLTLNDAQIYTRNLQQQRYAKDIKKAQSEWESILSEASAGRSDDFDSKFGGATPEVTDAIDGIQEADASTAAEGFRKERADYVTRRNLNKRLKSDATLLRRASGVDENGGDKVLARLQEESTSTYMGDVKAAKSVLSNDSRYNLQKIKDIVHNGTLADGTPASMIQRHAAIMRLAEETSNNEGVQGLLDWAHSLGFRDNLDASGNTIVDADGNPTYLDIFGNTISSEEAEARRDTQQITLAAYKDGRNRVNFFTGTDQGNSEVGRYQASSNPAHLAKYAGSELAITREINSGKVNWDSAFTADIDEINKQINVLNTSDVQRELVDPQMIGQYAKNLREFLADDKTGKKLEMRKKGAYDVLLRQLDAIRNGTPFDLAANDSSWIDDTGHIQIIPEDNRASRKPKSQRPTGPIRLT